MSRVIVELPRSSARSSSPWAQPGRGDLCPDQPGHEQPERGTSSANRPKSIDPGVSPNSATSPLWVSYSGKRGFSILQPLAGRQHRNPTPTIPNLGNASPSTANGPTGQVSTAARNYNVRDDRLSGE